MNIAQPPATKYGMYAAYCVLVLGFISGIIKHGLAALTDTAFWFGLYGWLAVAIVVGYLVSFRIANLWQANGK